MAGGGSVPAMSRCLVGVNYFDGRGSYRCALGTMLESLTILKNIGVEEHPLPEQISIHV